MRQACGLAAKPRLGDSVFEANWSITGYAENCKISKLYSTLLRRTARLPKTPTKGSLTLDIGSGRAFLDSDGAAADLLLTQKEFAVLLLLAQNEGTVMSAQSIYKIVWKLPTRDDKNTLQATISNLRKKIEPSGCAITVFRNRGYVFEQIG